MAYKKKPSVPVGTLQAAEEWALCQGRSLLAPKRGGIIAACSARQTFFRFPWRGLSHTIYKKSIEQRISALAFQAKLKVCAGDSFSASSGSCLYPATLEFLGAFFPPVTASHSSYFYLRVISCQRNASRMKNGKASVGSENLPQMFAVHIARSYHTTIFTQTR
jgi:hypothetical protein